MIAKISSRQSAVGREVKKFPPSPVRLPPSFSSSAMTLVELLVAVAIVAILASLLLGVAARAAETGRVARTKQLIARLHTLVNERYDQYRTQRVEIRDSAETNLTVANTGMTNLGSLSSGQREAAVRLAGIRELMKLEMPDRWSDVLLDMVPATPMLITTRGSAANSLPPKFVSGRPQLNELYLRAYNRAAANGVTQEKFWENQTAECLYLTVLNATGDGEARGLFKESDTGDTDGDGLLEFVDGWGNPIRYLRWAPGFDSDLQLGYDGLVRRFQKPGKDATGNDLTGDQAVNAALAEQHDPFDLYRVDSSMVNPSNFVANEGEGARAWRLVPLIYSAGGDEEYGLEVGREYVANADPYNNDFDTMTTGRQRLGSLVNTETPADNITNHLITAR